MPGTSSAAIWQQFCIILRSISRPPLLLFRYVIPFHSERRLHRSIAVNSLHLRMSGHVSRQEWQTVLEPVREALKLEPVWQRSRPYVPFSVFIKYLTSQIETASSELIGQIGRTAWEHFGKSGQILKWIEVRDHIQMNPFHVLEDPLLHPPHTALWFDHLFRDTQIFIQGVWDTTRMGGCGLEISLTDFVFTMGDRLTTNFPSNPDNYYVHIYLSLRWKALRILKHSREAILSSKGDIGHGANVDIKSRAPIIP